MSTLLVAAPASAATTILWTAQSSLGELFDTDADVARFVATRLMRNYQLDVGFEPNWGLGVAPPVLPVTPSNVRCLPAPDGGTALRPRWSGGTIAAGTEVSVACDVTLANASASPTQYVPELSVSESPPEGTVALPTATTATHDDPILGRT